MLLTERATHLRSHSGQVAFPGGKIDPGEGSIEAALREAEEEVGLSRAHVEPFGLLDPYLSGSGYRITPVVAEIHPPFELTINHHEVADTFEAPFAFVMDPKNHERQSREWKGVIRHFYAMPWENRYIWGRPQASAQPVRKALHLMWRALAEPVALFLAPFVLYVFYLLALRRNPTKAAHWPGGATIGLTIAGLLSLSAACFLRPHRGSPEGRLHARTVENGRVVPGHFE